MRLASNIGYIPYKLSVFSCRKFCEIEPRQIPYPVLWSSETSFSVPLYVAKSENTLVDFYSCVCLQSLFWNTAKIELPLEFTVCGFPNTTREGCSGSLRKISSYSLSDKVALVFAKLSLSVSPFKFHLLACVSHVTWTLFSGEVLCSSLERVFPLFGASFSRDQAFPSPSSH